MKGLLLSELFFKNYGVSLLDRFALTETAAAGLVGEGSECFGFDDELSGIMIGGPLSAFGFRRRPSEESARICRRPMMLFPRVSRECRF